MIFVSARSYAEYVQMFALDGVETGWSVLDCAAGGSTFTAEATRRGTVAFALDPLYARSQGEVIKAVRAGASTAAANTRINPGAYKWDSFFRNPEEHARHRRLTAEDFILDYTSHVSDRYIAGSVMNLPFATGSVDLVLSSHFIFTYADEVDRAQHIRAVSEMARVARREVRVFPVVGFNSDASASLASVRSTLESMNLEVTLERVKYRFLKETGDMLRVSLPSSSRVDERGEVT